MLLICAVAVLFIIGIVGWQLQEQRRLAQLHKNASLETGRIADRLVELKGEKLATWAFDYSFWDEMVDFVKTGDPNWAEINLSQGLESYQASMIAVYNLGGARVYSANVFDDPILSLLPIRPEKIGRLFSKSPFCHFFMETHHGLLEVRGAKILRGADTKRIGPCFGYFLVAKVWDSSYIKGLASLLDGKGSLQSVSSGSKIAADERTHSIIVYRKLLPDMDGHNLKSLCIATPFHEGELQKSASRRTIILLVLFAGVMITFIALGLSRFVSHPLGLISNAMQTQSPDTLSPLENDPSEFGRLATLIRKFFHQKVAFEEETRVRARAEEDVKRSEQNLSITLHSIGDAVISTDAHGRVVRMNPVAEELTGWTLSEAISRPISEVINIINAITGEPAPIPVDEVLSTGEVCHLANHTTLISRDGTQCQIADSAAPIRDNTGTITGVVMVFSDVTEQYRVREKLRESEAHFTQLAEESRTIVWEVNANGLYTYVSHVAEQVNGYRPDELVGGMHFYDLHPEAGREAFKKAALTVFARKESFQNLESTVQTKDGRQVWVSTNGTPLFNPDGSLRGYYGSDTDITENKRAEESLRDGESRALSQRLALADLVGNEAIGSGDIEAATRILTEATSSVLRVDRSSIWLLSADSNELVCIELFEAASETHSHGYILRSEDYPRYFEAIQNENRVPAEDARTDPRTAEFAQNYLIPLGITSMLDVGITLQGKLAGVVCLEHIGEKRQWHADEESFASTIAALMTQAMVNRSRKQAEKELFDAKNELEDINSQLEEALLVSKDHAAAMEVAKEQIEENAIELSRQATHDALTGLPNRHCFEQHLGEIITSRAGKKSRSFVVLFLDLDKFKLINDTLGHKVGDMLLIEVADRLQSCLRSEDLLARMGGDEFTVILPRCRSRSIAQSVASRMIDSISRPFDIQGHKFVIGASIGLASYPSNGMDTVTLLKHADAAMYRAKQSGRGTFRWYSGDVDVENQQRADIERDIRYALESNQFKVYYQPIVSLEDGEILYAEALLRWEHPEKGMISPSLFILIAEEIGVIDQIGSYVLRTACAQTMAWRDEGIYLSQIAVNVSTRQICDASWLDSVSAILSDTGLDVRCLNMELTETDFATDYESMHKILHKVRELGIGIAIDDFGIGQSSLSRLKDFPVNHLKIDGSFVRDIEHNKSDNALLRSIVEMARGQCIKVTAEWVETESQMEILRSIGCDFAQGYFISPALPAEAFGDFAREWTSAQRAADAA